MKFNSRVAIISNGGDAYVRNTHAGNALRLCEGGIAKRISKSVIELQTSVAQARLEVEPSAVRAMAAFAPKRGNYHQHTTPNMDRKTPPPCFYRSDAGQTGGLRHLSSHLRSTRNNGN